MAAREHFSPRTVEEVSRFIQDNYGIKIPPTKEIMLESRLRRRMRQIGFNSLSAYIDYVFSPTGRQKELTNMVDVLTTNKTEFFREPSHFEILADKVVPQLTSSRSFSPAAGLRIWSAACSSGEEPYTIAMVLSELAVQGSPLNFSILASDLSTKVLKKAYVAIYDEKEAQAVPLAMRKKYFLKSKEPHPGLVRLVDSLRRTVTFHRINLMANDFGLQNKMHVIFCRNALIYFNRQDQERLMTRFADQLVPGGFLFIGHSESLAGMNTPFVPLVSTVYRKE